MSDWNFGEVFNSSLMRGLAENAEKEKYQQEFAYRDQQTKVENTFKQMQYNKLLEQVDEQTRHNSKMENLSQLANASNEFVGVGADDPIMKHFKGISSISPEEYTQRAGALSHADPNQRFVEKAVYDRYAGIYNTEVVNDRYYTQAEAKAKLLTDKEDNTNNQYNGLLSRLYNAPTPTADAKQVADPLKTWYDPTVMFPANRTNPETGQKERAAWFGLGKKIETGQTFHTEYSANPQSVATRADTLASVFTDINKFTGTKEGKLYAGQLKTSAFNELVDLAYQSQGKNIPYGKQAGVVINQLMPFVKSGIEDFKVKAQKEINAAQSKAMSAKDDQTKADALAIVDEWKRKLEDPLYGLDHVKTLYMNQYIKKGN